MIASDNSAAPSLVLSAYPLTTTFQQSVTEATGSPAGFLYLNQLRHLRPLAAVKSIRANGARRCIIAIEDPGSYAVLPALRLMAVFSRARDLEIVHPNLRRESFSRARAASSLWGVFVASLDGFIARARHRKGIERLISMPRKPARMGSKNSALYVNPNMWFGLRAGGAVAHMGGLINAFTDLGYAVDFASLVPLALRNGATNRTLTAPEHLGLPEETNYFRFQTRMFGKLAALVSSTNYDFIYQRLSVHNYVGVLVSRLANLPLVLEYNGSEAWAAQHWGTPLRFHHLAVAAEDVSLRHAHLVVVVSDVLRREVVQRGVEPSRVVTCPNGFDPRQFSPDRFGTKEVEACRATLGIPLDAVVATFVGTFGRWHGIELLARVIRRLITNERTWLERQKLRFVLVGDGARMSEVVSILGHGSSDFVVMPGLLPPEAIPLQLAASDILLAPHVPNADGSEFFGSPTKLFEYMAMGKAVIASDLGQIGQVLNPSLMARELPMADASEDTGCLGVLVTPNSEDELIGAIRFLASNPRWRQELGQFARERALQRHTWLQSASEIVRVLSLLETRL